MTEDLIQFKKSILKYAAGNYKKMLRNSEGALKYPFMVPGSSQYTSTLWDWDSWLTDIALHQIAEIEGVGEEIEKYAKGCVLNFLHWAGLDGWIPITIEADFSLEKDKPEFINDSNMHKPVLAQHAAFIVDRYEDAEWLREDFYYLQAFVNNYRNYRRHHETGLYFWTNDECIGVDNDPSTFFRPDRSSASILLNCFLYKELRAVSYIADRLGLLETSEEYLKESDDLKKNIQEHCWDERDGFFYSVDLNILPVDPHAKLHIGGPRDWTCLIQRLGVWSGFLAMWSGVATDEQAERMVIEHLRNEKTFNSSFGIRTLSKMEKMYSTKATGNPSNWLGPIWGLPNYMVFKSLIDYGYEEDAKVLAEKTIRLFGSDLATTGDLHEYYEPENGKPLLNKGFQNWNLLAVNMISWLDGKAVIKEF